jgi:hypothetical protein
MALNFVMGAKERSRTGSHASEGSENSHHSAGLEMQHFDQSGDVDDFELKANPMSPVNGVQI